MSLSRTAYENRCVTHPLPIFNSCLFNRIRFVPIYAHESSKRISLIKIRIKYLPKALLARFSKIIIRTNKNQHGKGYRMLIGIFFLKVMNNDRKILTCHEMIAWQKKLCWWSLKCMQNQLFHPKLRLSNVSFTYLLKFTYFCFVDVWTLEKEFCLRK